MKIKLFKLNSGEHMLAEVIGETVESYTLKNHCMVFPAPDQTNGVKVLPSYNMFDDAGVELSRSQIVYEGYPQEEIREQYEAAFGSGILVQSTQILRG